VGRWEPELPAGAPPLHLFLTPCPQRSARSPRTGSQLSFRTASLNFSVALGLSPWEGDRSAVSSCRSVDPLHRRFAQPQIALDGGLRLTVPSALLSAPEATAVSSSDPQHLPGTPGFATPLFSPSLSCCVMPTLPAALSLPFFLLPLIVDVATPLCSQHASWPAPLAGPLQSHPGSSQLHQRTPLAADGPGLS